MSSSALHSDQNLVILLQAGDESAFAEIYNRYALLLYRQANQMLHDPEASKDLVQDLFLTIWSNAQQLKADANLAGYFYIAVRNRVFKLIERGRLKNDYLSSIALYASEINTDTIDALNERDLQQLIDAEIERLPPQMKRVFELSRKEHLSHLEIAERLGISDKTVKKQINKAIKILRVKLRCFMPLGLLMILLFKK